MKTEQGELKVLEIEKSNRLSRWSRASLRRCVSSLRLSRFVWVAIVGVVVAMTSSCMAPNETIGLDPDQSGSPLLVNPANSAEIDKSGASVVENGLDRQFTVDAADLLTPRFSVTTTHRTAPNDIIKELQFVAGGGGAESNSCLYYESPTVLVTPEHKLGPWSVATTKTCGWQYREKVTVVLTKPDGTKVTELAQASDDEWAVEFSYRIDLNEPFGRYELAFNGEHSTLESTFEVEQSSDPMITHDGGSRILLSNFTPHERLRLFAYSEGPTTASLVAWQLYQADRNGQLIVSFDSNEFSAELFVAIGDVSGEVRPSFVVWPFWQSTIKLP